MNPLIQLKKATPVFVVTLVCVGLLPTMRAVSPPPDGGYPGANMAEGQDPLLSLTTGRYNTAIGWLSLTSNTTGQLNTATGAGTLLANTADNNTATGAGALLSNTMGSDNTANGAFALISNTTGYWNTASGVYALFSNTTGGGNTANGHQALFSNATGDGNTAVGELALGGNTTGNENTAMGIEALINNNTGGYNTAMGFQALFSNTTGDANTALGARALANNTTGVSNIAVGASTGSGVTTASNVICIGADGANVTDSCFISNIYSNVQPVVGTDPDYVTINSSDRLGRGNVSSRRYKHDIKPMDKASEALFALRPVSFRYNKEYDATQTTAFGLIAEEVAEVNPALVGRNDKGEPESVRYEQINAMLLNEFLKEHRKVQELEATLVQQEKDFTARLNEQDAKIQQVSDKMELSKPAPQVVNNR